MIAEAQSARTLTDLNEPQQRAVVLPVTQPPTHGLILAGAGSGKTRVLTTRIAWLLAGGQAGAHEILAVTFTNKAAREMTTRLAAQTAVNVRGLWIGTFHGLCNRLLRLHHREANLPQTFQILDVTDQLAAIKRLMKNLGIDDESYPPRDIQYFINAHKEKGVRADGVETWDGITRRKAEIYAEYEAQCQREGVADFAELLLRAYELLFRHEPLRTHYQQRFRHILVDEFQDTNRLQYGWLKLLAGGGAAMFAVGDDDQSIYAFRGAEVGNMRDFERDFANAQVIRLEQNYRSHGHILAAANALIQHNRERLGKELWTDAGAGEPIRVYEAMGDQDEAGFVAGEARALMEEGSACSQIAVLYRSNAQSRVLEHEFFARGIAYRVYGGLRFFERQEIKHALAYLRLIANPDDDTAFLRVVNFPTRGIGARSLENLQTGARQINASLYAAAASLSGKAAVTVGGFVRLIERLRAETLALSLPEQIEHVIEHSGLAGHYQNEKEGQERLENLDELINAAAVFVASEEVSRAEEAGGALPAFLGYATLESGEHQAGEGEEAVQLMTVHAAKGLEFDVVFITGLEQGLFPHDNAASDARGLEEERRLMYVAITRARRRLYLSSAQTRMLHGQVRYATPSQFLAELPPQSLKLLSRPRSAHANAAFWRAGFAPFQRPPVVVREPADFAPELPGGLKLGMNVRHARFGLGVIIDAKGSGEETSVEVNFGGAGIKWLALAYAKLEPATARN
ncbi:MAG: UvrD-helicase domain-containing protein [Zoogloeaceae bacterium]|jgi:DNA helicase-2/ATP-dependent DNA helicase PcrA|nr:UvrD-helicase domain-containing protein [Zoogloeaceae bacterium]